MTVSLPNVPKTKATKKVSTPTATEAVTPEVVPDSACLTYGQAIKLVARILQHNPNDGGAVLVESIRDVVSGTGLDVDFVPDEQAQEEEEETEV